MPVKEAHSNFKIIHMKYNEYLKLKHVTTSNNGTLNMSNNGRLHIAVFVMSSHERCHAHDREGGGQGGRGPNLCHRKCFTDINKTES